MIYFRRLPEDIRIGSFGEYLFENNNIIFAYLFEGLTHAKPSPMSDVGIAIYVKNHEKFQYMDSFIRISKFRGTDELALVVLSKTPLSIAGRIVLQKMILLNKEPFLRHCYESLTLRKFFDFRRKKGAILKMRYGVG